MRSKIEYVVNNRSKLVEKLIMLEDRNNSQFNKESYHTWKKLAEECSNSGDITMFANGYKEELQEKILTKRDLQVARLILKTSINPKEIAAAQNLIKEYNKQQEETKNESLTKQQENSPKRYVYEICDELGWNPPTFIDSVVGGYRLRYKLDSKEEAQVVVDAIKDAASELGITVKKALVKPTGDSAVNDDYVPYDGPMEDHYNHYPDGTSQLIYTSPAYSSKEFKKWQAENTHPRYYSYVVIPRYEPEEATESLSDLDEAYKHLNNREKQVYIDIINNPEECEDIDDLKDIVHEIFFYDKALFAMMNRFPKDASFEELKANKIAILKDSMLDEDWNIEDQIDAPDTIGKLNPGDKFKNRNGVEITIVEPQKDGTIQYKIGDEVRAGSEKSIQKMLYKNNYLREDYNSFLTLADNDANKLRNEYDKGDKSIFDILTSLNYIQDDPDSVYMYKEVSDGYAIVFDLSSYDEGKNYVKYFVVDENNNIPKGYTITKLLIEDYQHDKDEWGDPYSYDEVERELKNITNDWTDEEGTIRCYWEQEKNYGLQILKQHYRHVEVSDGRTGSGENMSWVLSYSRLKENINEDFKLNEKESLSINRLNEASKVDLSDAIKIGLDAYLELTKAFNNIPNIKPKYTRGKSWSEFYYVIFDLGVNIRQLAQDYVDQVDPDNYDLYWKYINDFEDKANQIVKKFNTDRFQLSVCWFDSSDTTSRYHTGHGKFDNHATMTIYDLANPTRQEEAFSTKALTKSIITIKDYEYDLVDNLDEDEIEVFNNLEFIKDNKVIIPKDTVLKYVGNAGRQLLYQVEGTDEILAFNNMNGKFENDFNDYFQITESLNESVTSQLQDKIIDCLDWFILMEMEFPKDKFLADSWEDVKDGIQMGIDPQFEVAEGIIEYLKPIITFNKKYNKEVGEEGVFQDEIEMYQSLVRAMNNYLAKNGYEDRIGEDFSFEDNVDQMKDLMGQNSNLFNKMIDDVETPKKDTRIFKFLKRKEK